MNEEKIRAYCLMYGHEYHNDSDTKCRACGEARAEVGAQPPADQLAELLKVVDRVSRCGSIEDYSVAGIRCELRVALTNYEQKRAQNGQFSTSDRSAVVDNHRVANPASDLAAVVPSGGAQPEEIVKEFVNVCRHGSVVIARDWHNCIPEPNSEVLVGLWRKVIADELRAYAASSNAQLWDAKDELMRINGVMALRCGEAESKVSTIKGNLQSQKATYMGLLDEAGKEVKRVEGELREARQAIGEIFDHIDWMKSHAKLRIEQTKEEKTLNAFNQGRADGVESLLAFSDTVFAKSPTLKDVLERLRAGSHALKSGPWLSRMGKWPQ